MHPDLFLMSVLMQERQRRRQMIEAHNRFRAEFGSGAAHPGALRRLIGAAADLVRRLASPAPVGAEGREGEPPRIGVSA